MKTKVTLLISVLALVILVFAAGAIAETEKAPKVFDKKQAVGVKATCPVMKGEHAISESTLSSEYEGKHVYFCCPSCKEKFDADPEKYLKE